MRFALCISVAFNLLLATTIVVARVDRTRLEPEARADGGQLERLPSDAITPPVGPETETESTRLANAAVQGIDGVLLQQYYRALRSRGLSHKETVLPIAGLVFTALSARSRPGPSYWEPAAGNEEDPDSPTFIERLEDDARRALIDLYGDAVVGRPEFAQLFYPLGEAFAFLSSDQQIGIVRWQRSLQRNARPSGGGAAPHGGPGCPRNASAQSAPAGNRGRASEALVADVRHPPGLDSGLAFEYALRSSPLAARLRRLKLDEASFREAFRLLDRLTDADDIRDHLQSRADLRRLLGPGRFISLWSELDPFYRAIASRLEKAGIAVHLIESAYSISLDTEEALLSLLARQDDGAAAAARIAAERRAEHDRLATIIGPELATAIQSLRVEPRAGNRGAGDDICAVL